jgi:hypothetical protein
MLSEYSTIGWKTDLVQLNIWDESKGAKEIIINPKIFLERLENVFINYMDGLLNQKEFSLRDSFAKKFYIDTGVKIKF